MRKTKMKGNIAEMNKGTLLEHLYVELILLDTNSSQSLRTVAKACGVGD